MISEKKCWQCSEWTDGNKKHCEHCGALIDHHEIFQEKQKKIQKEKEALKIANENKLERFIRKLENSDKPLHNILLSVIRVVFSIYMAILSFFIWLIALISG